MRGEADKRPLYHLIFWVGYLSFKVYHEYLWTISRYDQLSARDFFEASFIAQACLIPVKLLFVYWLVYWLMPRTEKNLIKAVFSLIGLAMAIVLYRLSVVYAVIPWAYRQMPEEQQLFSLERISSATVDIATVTGISAMIVLYVRNKAAKARESLLEKEKIAAELQFLKNQTNPHFLFNTLNNLYSLARKQSEKTPEAILQLSRFMRFVLYDTDRDTISLQEEVQIIDNYIGLEQLRFGERVKVSFKTEGELESCEISPLILLPLVENAFKHGASEMESDGFIDIRLEVNRQELSFEVENSFRPGQHSNPDGIGLKNLKRQLMLKYPDHQLSSSTDDNVYTASLKLKRSSNG